LQGGGHIRQQLLHVEEGADLPAEFVDCAQLAVPPLFHTGEIVHAFCQGDNALAYFS
jgi:hypothetical protein